MFKTRTRMVSFRLSEDEYERLRDLSESEHARSVSEFARAALCRLPTGSGESASTAMPRMDKLEGTVRQLKLEMHQLREMFETAMGVAPGAAETANGRTSNETQGGTHGEAVRSSSAF